MRYKLNTDDIELYAQKRIAEVYGDSYLNMVWNKKSDEYDFTSDDGRALEVTSVISCEIREVVQYENAIDKKGSANISKVTSAIKVNESQETYMFKGGSLAQYRVKCIDSIRRKNEKAIRRELFGKNYSSIELCLCIHEAPFFDELSDFDFLSEEFEKSLFDRLFIITRDRFFTFVK